MLELDSANSDNQFLTVLHSGKETSVVWTHGKKAVDGTVESTKAAEEPTKLLTVSLPLNLFKQTITQRGFLSRSSSRTLILTYWQLFFFGQMCPFSLCLP